MSNKREILDYISMLGREKLLSKDELISAFENNSPEEVSLNKKFSIQDIMYYIGAAIVFFGLAIMVAQNWEFLGDAAKVLISLGSAVTAFISGTLFSRHKTTERVGIAFHLIAALLFPLGLGVTFDVAGLDISEPIFMTLISGMLFAMYLVANFLFKKSLFVFFTILFGTWLFYSVTGWLMSDSLLTDDLEFFEYRALVSGLSYILLAQYFSLTESYKSLVGFLYGFGIFVFLGAALALGGWDPDQNIFWELVFPILVFGSLFLSVVIKRTSFLTFGTIYLMIYILKITGEYFSTGLGWPLALVCAGFMLIGTGYASFYVKRKYLNSKTLQPT